MKNLKNKDNKKMKNNKQTNKQTIKSRGTKTIKRKIIAKNYNKKI